METPNLNETIIKIAKEINIETLFLIAKDDQSTACCVAGSSMDLSNALAHLFNKNPAVMDIAEVTIKAVKQNQTDMFKSIFEC